MKILFQTLLLIVLQSISDCKITLDSYTFVGDENLINNFTSAMYKDSKGMTFVNASGHLAVDFFSGVMEVVINGWKGVRSPETERSVFKGNIDICDLTKGIVGSFVSIFVTTFVEKYSNMKVLCPMPNGYYYLKHCPIDVERYIPPLWIDSGSWELFVKMKVKLTASKPSQLLFDMKAYGTTS